jgi:hypothetical protein
VAPRPFGELDGGPSLRGVRELVLAGVDLPVLFPMPADGDWGYEKTIAAMAGKIT